MKLTATANCKRVFPFLWKDNGQAREKKVNPASKPFKHTNKHTLLMVSTAIHTNTHGGTKLHISAKSITKIKH